MLAVMMTVDMTMISLGVNIPLRPRVPAFPVHIGGADYYRHRRSREGPGPYRNHPFLEGMFSHILISVFPAAKVITFTLWSGVCGIIAKFGA